MAKRVKMEVKLPKSTLVVVDKLASQGLLGDTREEVILHMLRQYVFDRAVIMSFPPAGATGATRPAGPSGKREG